MARPSKSVHDSSSNISEGVNLNEVVADRSKMWKLFLKNMELGTNNSQNKSINISKLDETITPSPIDEDLLISQLDEDSTLKHVTNCSDTVEKQDDIVGLCSTVLSSEAVEKNTSPNENEFGYYYCSVGVQCQLGKFEKKYTVTNFVDCFAPDFDNEQKKSLLWTFDVKQIRFFIDTVLNSNLYSLQISREEARLLSSCYYADYNRELLHEANRVAEIIGKSGVIAYYLMHKADISLIAIKDIIEVENGSLLGQYLCDKLMSEDSDSDYYSEGHRKFALEWSRLIRNCIPVEYLVIYCIDLGDTIIEQLSRNFDFTLPESSNTFSIMTESYCDEFPVIPV